MINNISFGSTYRVNLSENSWGKLDHFQQLECDLAINGKTPQMYTSWKENNEHQTMVVDDVFDDKVEAFLKSRNIKFHKYTRAELFSQKSIKNRLVVPNHNYPTPRYMPNLVSIKTKDFDKLFQNSSIYLSRKDKIKNPDRYCSFLNYIKTAEPIDAPEVYISEQNGKPIIDFQDGTHRYAVMRDMRFESIPVAMNAESFETALKYKLVAQIH